MIDLDEIYRRAQGAKEQAARTMQEMKEKSEQAAQKAVSEPKQTPEQSEEEQQQANAERQVEILGQMLTPEMMARMAENEAQMRENIQQQVAAASAAGMQELLEKMGGEEMGLLAAALETLSLEEEEEEDEEELFGPEEEDRLCTLLEETMERIEALYEPEPVFYGKEDARWRRFGILLSGIISTVNTHSLDRLDVEEHLPVLEQQVASLVRRSWGISGRGELLETIRYLAQEGYRVRYEIYAQESPENLIDEEEDAEEQEAVMRAWRFVRRYRPQYGPGFLTGWDVGRAAMLARWGCYLGWITQSEAAGILHQLSQTAAEELCSWREFAQSYLFGGVMWKLLCGDSFSSVSSYLGYLADAVCKLLDVQAVDGGQWAQFPWPARRQIGL